MKVRIVLDILEARTTIVQAAREHQVSETSIGNWKRQFVEAGCAGLMPGRSAESAQREAELESENAALRSALDETTVLVDVWRNVADGRLGPFGDLESIRRGSGIPVSRFCSLVGIPRRTYHRKQSQLASGEPTSQSQRPSPSVDAAAKLLEEYLAEHEDFGHRRLHALMAADGHVTSTSTVLRAMRRLDADGPAPLAPAHTGADHARAALRVQGATQALPGGQAPLSRPYRRTQ